MPSWNEKPFTVPTLNVNLAKCNCGHAAFLAGRENGAVSHSDTCASRPILIPCPIPRSVTLKVALGWCACPPALESSERYRDGGHLRGCPARPASVSCSIGGETWEKSEVQLLSVEPSDPTADRVKCMSAARARWALVKALVLGRSHQEWSGDVTTGAMAMLVGELFAQRDVVFAALADMARAERAAHAAFLALPMEIRRSSIMQASCGHVASDLWQEAIWPARQILGHYVERLIEQVGALS
jgi:hypothetical protein